MNHAPCKGSSNILSSFLKLPLQGAWGCFIRLPRASALGCGGHWAFSPHLRVLTHPLMEDIGLSCLGKRQAEHSPYWLCIMPTILALASGRADYKTQNSKLKIQNSKLRSVQQFKTQNSKLKIALRATIQNSKFKIQNSFINIRLPLFEPRRLVERVGSHACRARG